MRIAVLLALASLASSAICQDVLLPGGEWQAMAVPSLPFYDWNATPGEGRTYGQWTAHEPVPVYNSWQQPRRVIAHLTKGDKVTALSGGIVTYKPGLIRIDRDLPNANLRTGDTILTYSDRGEGFSAVWFKGRYNPSFDISFTKWPDGSGCGGDHCAATYLDLGTKSWWVKVELEAGTTGWVEMNLARIPVSLY